LKPSSARRNVIRKMGLACLGTRCLFSVPGQNLYHRGHRGSRGKTYTGETLKLMSSLRLMSSLEADEFF
jgi:hypothetical protein